MDRYFVKADGPSHLEVDKDGSLVFYEAYLKEKDRLLAVMAKLSDENYMLRKELAVLQDQIMGT